VAAGDHQARLALVMLGSARRRHRSGIDADPDQARASLLAGVGPGTCPGPARRRPGD